ncbi:MAG: cytochrome P450 [Acidimicrobiales bacterium]|nr:cytochrome P450 [Acidimicrobiales bacterium]
MTTLSALHDPDTYVDGPPHELLAELRRTQPVYWQEMDGEPGFWAVLTHADVTTVARQPVRYSAWAGGVVLENLDPENLEMLRNMLLAMDPPRHTVYRRPLAPPFKARTITRLEDRIRAICREIMAEARERGDVEFVHQVAAPLPSQVIGELFGLPREDWDHIHELAERNTSAQDPDMAGSPEDAYGPSMELAMYGIELAARRRQEEPREDLTSLLLDADFDGQPMSDVDFGVFLVQLVTAGNDTTKTMLASGLVRLLDHPDQLATLRADHSLIPGAIEEILRYDNPLHYFRRTTTEDVVLHDVPIAAGEKVAMWYTSANRDELVFPGAQRFDIRRSPNPHLSFGIGEHFCLGAHLARLEGRVFLEELLDTFATVELTGTPQRTRSNLNNAIKRLPVRLAG